MSAFELVTLLFVPQLFSRALTRQDYSFTNAVIGATTLLTLVWVTSLVAYRFPRVAHALTGEPSVLVSDGEFLPNAMDRERVSAKDLYAEFHRVGLHQVKQVRWAILETSGAITIVPMTDDAIYRRGGVDTAER